MAGSTEAQTAAGSTIAISAGIPATVTPTGYAALTYTLIGEVTELPAMGRTYNEVTHSPLAERGVVKKKGSYNDGTLTIPAAYAPGDAGQVLVDTAVDDDDYYSFKTVLQDGTIRYSQAMVMSAPVTPGSVDSIVNVSIGLSVKSGSIVTVLPA